MGTNYFRHVFCKFFCAFGFISICNASITGVACNAWCINSGAVCPPLECYCRCDVCLSNLYCCTAGCGGIVVHRYLVVNYVCTCIGIFWRLCKVVCIFQTSVFHYRTLWCCNSYSMGLVVVCSFVSLCSNSHCCRCDCECRGCLAFVIVRCLGYRGFDGMGTNKSRLGFSKFFCTFCLISIGNGSITSVTCNAWRISGGSICPALKCYSRCDVSLVNLYRCTTSHGGIVILCYLIVYLVCSGIGVCG